MLDRVEGQVELRDHAARPERRQHLAQPGLRPVVEREDHRPARQPGAGVPVGGQVARQDRRVAVRPEPVELGLEGGRQRVVGEERPPALGTPVAELGRDRLHAVVVDDGDAAPGDAHRRRRREGMAPDRRGEAAVRGSTRRSRGCRRRRRPRRRPWAGREARSRRMASRADRPRPMRGPASRRAPRLQPPRARPSGTLPADWPPDSAIAMTASASGRKRRGRRSRFMGIRTSALSGSGRRARRGTGLATQPTPEAPFDRESVARRPPRLRLDTRDLVLNTSP